jgi:PAS domain S-box-containing protein
VCRILLLFFAFFCIVVPLAAATASSPRPQRQQLEVLVVSFSDPDQPDVAALIEEAETQILENGNLPVHFTLEYLSPFLLNTDLRRRSKTLSFLQEKHHGQTFDLVVTIGEETPAFGEKNLTTLFPDVPLVFCTVSPTDTAKWLAPKSGRTGVIRKLNYLPTLQLALRENPGTRQVIVIAGSSEFEKLEMNVAHDEFRTYEPNVTFQYWTDLRLTDLKSRLASVQPDTVILFIDFRVDAEGEQFVPSRILPTIRPAANRPMYGTFASFVGKGVVGGSVADLRQIGRIIGQDGARILKGEKPETIAVETGEFQRNVFDWREVHRWGITTRELPPGSSVLNWEYSPWELYRWRIFGLSAAVFIETLLIFLLLHARATRRRAEQALRRKSTELSEAERLARIGSWHWNPKSGTFDCSDELFTLIGLDPKLPSPLLNQLVQFFTPESWVQLTQSMERALQTDETYDLELEAVRAHGNRMWVAIRGETVRARDGHVVQLRGTMQDITERKRAEEARLKHSAIVESSDDSIISTTLEGIITGWNSGAQRMFGFSEAEAVGQPITIVIPPELQDEADITISRVLKGERVEHREAVRVREDGKRIYVSLTACPVRDSAGRIVGISRLARDITERKLAEAELKKSAEMFSKAFRQGPMAMTLTSAKNQRYIDVNETFEHLTGYRRDELIGRTPVEVGIWADPSERTKFVKEVLSGNRIRDAEFSFITKDGETRVAQASADLIEVAGEPCVLGASIDITERKRSEQVAQESEKRFRLMADSAPVLMWTSGPDKLCSDFNKEWLRFTGRTMQQELGEGWTHGIHPGDLQGCLRSYSHAFDLREKFAIEYRLRRHDGQYRWILDQGLPRFLEDGSFAGYIGCCVDITDQKEAKAAQAELSGRLMQAHEEERARIARELHDDINQRLALLASGIQELEISECRKETQMGAQLHALWQLTSEIAADIQHLSHELHPSKLHYLGLSAATRGLCQEFSKLHKIEVECIVRDLPSHLDESVSLTLFRTAQESLHNVAKHSHAHHVKVELIGGEHDLRLRVSDDGVGFDPRQANNTQGLGLVSMQERLKLVGGQLSIWSRPSLGTQVEGTVPVTAKYALTA